MKPYTLLVVQLSQRLSRRAAEEEAKLRLFGTDLSHDAKGKPMLISKIPLGVSLSHSRHWLVALLVPEGMPAGVDIEEKGAQAERTLGRYSTEKERKLLDDDGLTPLHLWTAKEALYKAYSEQLSKGINQITFEGVDRFAITFDNGETKYQLVEWIEWEGALIAHNVAMNGLKIEVV
ncbi:MAG: 4'-phosphopantetheinyl transferase superfamily protein [Bacteroidales bacterium]|uniref:4'-phosphopantetheinyl transferase family protein n=1 Tax=Porphyromonas sp. TaxID=1924944 RepID=UPI002978A5FF|nr:4'-phosphopantetheinyl transferase superfamily protein [Porphyromonas sp.]MDD7437896.1 4'-phosphopantetheinyl transferase superfamily protein [Bacteroidales bacterium]MDY3067781.1 4'-phosphopantetheinyl transferase superfamily protein [Porphyromonas sp.]